MFQDGDKIKFTTSVGEVVGTANTAHRIDNGITSEIHAWLSVEFDADNTHILNKLYNFDGGILYEDGWVNIMLSDGHYGSPEYKATLVT